MKEDGLKRNKKKIAVICGGASQEHEVSCDSGSMVLNSLDKTKYDIVSVKIDKSGKWFIDKDNPLDSLVALDVLKNKHKIKVAFIALHGTGGEDGTIQGLLDFIGIPYTGSKVLGSALAMDKEKSAELFKYHNLTIPKYEVVIREE